MFCAFGLRQQSGTSARDVVGSFLYREDRSCLIQASKLCQDATLIAYRPRSKVCSFLQLLVSEATTNTTLSGRVFWTCWLARAYSSNIVQYFHTTQSDSGEPKGFSDSPTHAMVHITHALQLTHSIHYAEGPRNG